MKLRPFSMVLGVTLFLTPFAVSRAATLYVSTEGRAGWSGSIDKPNLQQTDGPLPSLAAARDRIHALRARRRTGCHDGARAGRYVSSLGVLCACPQGLRHVGWRRWSMLRMRTKCPC